MANVKITDLTELAAIDIATNDVLPIVDLNNDSTKKVTIASLTASIAAANDYATYTILNANIDVVSGNADAYYTQLNANIDVVQANVSALSSVLTVSNTGTTDDVTVGTDDLVFVGTNGLTPLITNDTVTYQLDDTAVTAGLYGGVEGTVTNVAVITVDAQGRITAASNATVAVDLATLESNVNTVQDNVVAAEANVTAVEARRADNTFFTYNSTGDQANVIINAANVEPSQNNIFSLGAPDKVWKDLYVGPGSIKLGNVTMTAVETGLKIEDAGGATTQLDTSVANVTANLNLIQDNVNQVSQDLSALETRRNDNVTIRINAFTGTNAAIVAAESRLNSNLDVTNDNAATLTTTVDNFGSYANTTLDTKANVSATYFLALANDFASYTRLQANIDLVQDNVASVTVGTAADTETRLNANLDVTNDNVSTLTTTVDNFGTYANTNLDTKANVSATYFLALANDFATYSLLNANLDIIQDNVSTLTTTVDNFGTSSNSNASTLAAGIVSSETRLNANLDVIQDNVAAIIDGTTQFTGDVTMQQALTVSGNLYVAGAQVDLGISSAQIDDATLLLAANTPGDAQLAADSGIVINRGQDANVFFGFAAYGNHVDFIFTDAPADNVNHYAIAYVDVHANSFGAEGTHDPNFTAIHHADRPTTGFYFPTNEIVGVIGGAYKANITASGLEAVAVYSDGVELQANDSATLFSAYANDYATHTQISANVDVVQDNVATLTTTVDNFGTSSNANAAALASDIAAKLDSADYTAADVLSKLLTVDGSGSALDADLLDGQHANYYAVETTRSSNAAELASGIASAVAGSGISSFSLEDDDSTSVEMGDGQRVKFIEGGGVDINFTDVSPGSVADPYDLTFTVTSSVIAGAGLTGGGQLNADRTLNIGAGTGVTVNANDIAIGQAIGTGDSPTFAGLTVTTFDLGALS